MVSVDNRNLQADSQSKSTDGLRLGSRLVLFYIHQFFFFLRMRLRPIVGQPGSSSIISRVELGQTTIQLRKRAGFDDVGHRLGLTMCRPPSGHWPLEPTSRIPSNDF